MTASLPVDTSAQHPTASAGADAARTERVAVIILNWNGKDDTLECLHSVAAIDYPALEVVVVDNGSQDGSVQAIRAAFPHITIVETGANLGYAGGNNAGIRYCLENLSTDFLLLLNNDTLVDPHFITRLVVASHEHPRAAVLGPKILRCEPPDVLWFAGGYWKAHNSSFSHVGDGEKDTGQFDEDKETDFVTGCAMLMRTSVVREIGPLDERFFLTHEDVDWCYRARSAGYSCRFVPAARVHHKVSASFARGRASLGIYFTARNRLLWAEMHLPALQRLRVYTEAGLELLIPRLLSHRRSTAPLAKRLYWLLRDGFRANWEGYSDPSYRAWRYGASDYIRRRFGDCPADVRLSLTKDAEAFRTSAHSGP